MKIEDIELEERIIGSKVTYAPDDGVREYGEITSWNDRFVFVKYTSNTCGCATDPKKLIWG